MSHMQDGFATGPEPRRRPAAWAWWLAGLLALALAATGLWIGLRPDTGNSATPLTVTSPSPTPSVSPSRSASPTPPPPEPKPAAYELAALPRPAIDGILPRELPHAKIDTLRGLPGSVAAPRSLRIPVWPRPDVTKKPVLALESVYYDADARWLVLERRPGWVKVLVPYGRGALPSHDPEQVNGSAGWLRASDVVLRKENRSVVVDLSDRTLTIKHADGTTARMAAAVGAPATPTPRGLTQVFTVTEAVNTGLSVFLSMQSESLDGFYGTNYAATAIHVGVDQGLAVSNGCVRLTSADFEQLTGLDPGVPVLIRD
ncbi:L,D-transpeptidase [Promicromonospora panici]|uniref:L,D-transpeptidase n=1 Tax=Promicromonospora panici TaxID=2219658 RepID=UPI0013EDBE52|nr:L,D-transpeptidase [Promicromonospora panici]